MSSSKNTKYNRVKDGFLLETCLYPNKVDGCPSTLFSTLLICLQYIGNHFEGDYVSRDVFSVPEKISDLSMLIFIRYLSGIQSAMKTDCGQ